LGENVLAQSVVQKSGQLWKFLLSLGALLLGSFAPLFPASGIGWTLGSVLAIAGYAFGIIAIRCRACGCMWFWEAAKDSRLYQRLFGQSSCPVCEHDFGTQ